MTLPLYLAMTAAEFMGKSPQDPHMAWMACHFSSYGSGLSNIPGDLPAGAMVILNDQFPIDAHDPMRICKELTELTERFQISGVLLDFQRQDVPKTKELCAVLTTALPCPVSVTEYYAEELSCPVFVSVPLRIKLCDCISKWKGREIWLEAVLDSQHITVSHENVQISSCGMEELPTPWFSEPELFCRYHWEVQDETAVFTVQRTQAELKELLSYADKLGVTRAVGLYQQLHGFIQ